MKIILLTTNPHKLPEYQQLMGRYHIQVEARPPEPSPLETTEFLRRILQDPKVKLLIKDETNLYQEDGTPAGPQHSGPTMNICRLQAWWLEQTEPPSPPILRDRTYIATVEGTLQGQHFQSQDPEVFGWDQAFTPTRLFVSYDQARKLQLKTSARSQALSALTRDFFWFPTPKALTWFEVPRAEPVDFSFPVTQFVATNPYLQNLPPLLSRLVNQSLAGGTHFRAAPSRRIGNYWLPGLNGGIPYTPKDDPIHEITYFFHDLMHYLVPDLLFDGELSQKTRRVYLASRMISEAISLVLADMLYVDNLRKSGIAYDFPKRRIHPLYQTLGEPGDTPASLKRLCWTMTRYCLLGEDVLGNTPEARNFIAKYQGFFVADWAWTAANWDNMALRTQASQAHFARLTPQLLASLGLETAASVAERLKITERMAFSEVVLRVFEHLFDTRVQVALNREVPLNPFLALSQAFRRYLTGQTAVFPRYQPLAGWPALADRLYARLHDPKPFEAAEISEIRQEYRNFLNDAARRAALSWDDARCFGEVFPLFDPFFVFYDRTTDQTIFAASHRAVA